MKKYSKDELESEIIFYCSKCFSMHIIRGKQIGNTDANVLTCGDCGAGPKHLDVTTLGRFLKLYEEAHGHHHLTEDPSPYSDLDIVYVGMAPTVMTESEALTHGMRVGEKINRKIDD